MKPIESVSTHTKPPQHTSNPGIYICWEKKGSHLTREINLFFPPSSLTTPSPSSLTLTAPSPSSFTLSPALSHETPHQATNNGAIWQQHAAVDLHWRQGSAAADSQPTQLSSGHSESLPSHLYSPPTVMRHGYHGLCLVSL